MMKTYKVVLHVTVDNDTDADKHGVALAVIKEAAHTQVGNKPLERIVLDEIKELEVDC